MSGSIYVEIEGEGAINRCYVRRYLADNPELLDAIAKAYRAPEMTSYFRDSWNQALSVEERKNRWFEAKKGIKTFKAILKELQQNPSIGCIPISFTHSQRSCFASTS